MHDIVGISYLFSKLVHNAKGNWLLTTEWLTYSQAWVQTIWWAGAYE